MVSNGLILSTEEDLTKRKNLGWTLYLVLACMSIALSSSLPAGYNIGVINTPAEVIKDFCNESFKSRYDILLDTSNMNILWAFVVSVFDIGGCVGSLLAASLANNIGRKKTTLVSSMISLAGAIMFLFSRTANSVEMLVIGRLLVGLSAGLTSSIVPMYLKELSPARLTSVTIMLYPMSITIGVVFSQILGLKMFLGNSENWTYLLSLYGILVIISIPLFVVLPESPIYLLELKGNKKEATKELCRLRGVSASYLFDEMNELLLSEKTEGSSDQSVWGLADVAKEPRLRLILLLVLAMQLGQQTSGISLVLYYSMSIFIHAGMSDFGSQLGTIACGLVNFISQFWMARVLLRTGRRHLMLWATAVSVAALVALTLTTKLLSVIWWMPYLSTVCVLINVAAFGFSLGPVPSFIASEMLEIGPRSAGMAWGSLSNWFATFILGMSFPTLREALGPYCFLIFAAITAALFAFLKFYLPETLGKTPSQVTQLCSRGFSSRPLNSTSAINKKYDVVHNSDICQNEEI